MRADVVVPHRLFDPEDVERLGDSFGNVQSHGLAVAAGAADYHMTTGNDAHGNVTGGIQDGGTGTHEVTHPIFEPESPYR